jgi:transcriptional regulator with XRE-family HTH domain
MGIVTVGQRIKAARRYRGYTQEDLAKIIGVHYNTISNLESGKTELSFFTAMCISTALDVSLDYLAGRSDE